MGPWTLAWKYILDHRFKTAVLVASIVLTAVLPICIKILLWQFNQKILSRADQTPLVVGAIGSDLDLALNATYFRFNPKSSQITHGEVDQIRESRLALPIPIHAKFTARSYRVVGTELDYFAFRNLEIETGTFFVSLGDCVLGAEVASALSLDAGDQIISDRENTLGFGGQTPLKMNVSGVLKPSRSADDWAVFVDLKTAWVIEGLGHGHDDLSDEDDESLKILKRTGKEIIASPGVVSFIEITERNIESFHFHGDVSSFPVTSVIVIPEDERSAVLLEGRYETQRAEQQLARPGNVLRDLMAMVFRVNRFFDANALLIAISTALLLVLVVFLSMQLRQSEMETMFRIGCSRGTIAMLQFAELAIIFSIAFVIISLIVWGVWRNSGPLVEALLVG